MGDKINRILDNLSRTVAVPRSSPHEAREQKSWRGLRVGSWVTNRHRLHYRNIWIEPDTLMHVTKATSKGVTLQPAGQYKEAVEWTAENWRDHFTLARRRRRNASNK